MSEATGFGEVTTVAGQRLSVTLHQREEFEITKSAASSEISCL